MASCTNTWIGLFMCQVSLVLSGPSIYHLGFECPNLTAPHNGAMSLTYDWMRNRMAVFTCNPGHTLVGLKVLLCKGNSWSDNAPACLLQDCLAHYEAGSRSDGVYGITPDATNPTFAYCDMTTEGGGWTVFQRRVDNFTDFFRDWQNYKHGFGEVDRNFWLGLDALHHLTRKNSELYIHMMAEAGNSRYAHYRTFLIGGERDNYRIRVGNFKGNAGDSFSRHNGHMFSTKDRDNDASRSYNCAKRRKGAWWYHACYSSNLNGVYLNGKFSGNDHIGIAWQLFEGYNFSLKFVKMMTRRKRV